SNATKQEDETELLEVNTVQTYEPVLESIKLYPNPVSQVLNIDVISSESAGAVINILNPNGQLLKKESINVDRGLNTNRIDIRELNSGIYILQIISNNERLVKKFSVMN
ncbi:MAG: T9SS type A sorting domain-containing protein, partial [Bacteroidia bacterium]|nr:T9SS type A sorting domain-containing protein [Bacteroidia bacterium]